MNTQKSVNEYLGKVGIQDNNTEIEALRTINYRGRVVQIVWGESCPIVFVVNKRRDCDIILTFLNIPSIGSKMKRVMGTLKLAPSFKLQVFY